MRHGNQALICIISACYTHTLIATGIAHGAQPSSQNTGDKGLSAPNELGKNRNADRLRRDRRNSKSKEFIAILEEVHNLRSPQSDEEKNRLLELSQDLDIPISAQVAAAKYLAFSSELSDDVIFRNRAEEVILDLALGSENPERVRTDAMTYLIKRWFDDNAHRGGSRVIAMVRSEPNDDQELTGVLSEACKEAVLARPQMLDSLVDDPSPMISTPAKQWLAELRKLDSTMPCVDILVSKSWLDRRIQAWDARLRQVESRKVSKNATSGDSEVNQIESLSASEIRRALRKLRELPLIDVVALEVKRFEDAKAGVEAGRARAEDRVEAARRWAATGSSGIELPIFWTETSVFRTASGRIDSESTEHGFTISIGGREPRELRDDEELRERLADKEHGEAYVQMKEAERNLEGISDVTIDRAKTRLQQMLKELESPQGSKRPK